MSKKDNQKKFILAYKKHYGNVSKAAKAANVDRSMYYHWIKNDADFKQQIENIEPEEEFLDFLEEKAVKRIEDGSDSVLIFALKAKGKKRGWIEKQIIQDDRETDKEEVDYSQLSNDELRQLIELRRKLIRGRAEENGGSSSDA